MFRRNSELTKIFQFGGQTESVSETNFSTLIRPHALPFGLDPKGGSGLTRVPTREERGNIFHNENHKRISLNSKISPRLVWLTGLTMHLMCY